MDRKKSLRNRYENYIFKIKEPILDIGGGDGKFLESQGIKNATIIDLNPIQNPKYNYIKRDISFNLRLDNKYKTIFIMEVLEHLKKPMKLIKQVYNILEDDGVLYISVPYTELVEDGYSAGNWDNGHVSRWTKKEIINEMKEQGFNVEVIQTRRRFKGLGFFLPHCWIVLKLTHQKDNHEARNDDYLETQCKPGEENKGEHMPEITETHGETDPLTNPSLDEVSRETGVEL